MEQGMQKQTKKNKINKSCRYHGHLSAPLITHFTSWKWKYTYSYIAHIIADLAYSGNSSSHSLNSAKTYFGVRVNAPFAFQKRFSTLGLNNTVRIEQGTPSIFCCCSSSLSSSESYLPFLFRYAYERQQYCECKPVGSPSNVL